MKLEEFYELVGLSFINSEVSKKRENAEEGYREKINDLRMYIDKAYDAMYNSSLMIYGREIKFAQDVLDKLLFEAGKKTTSVSEAEWEENKNEILMAINNWTANRMKPINAYEDELEEEEIKEEWEVAAEAENAEEPVGEVEEAEEEQNEAHIQEDAPRPATSTINQFSDILAKLKNAKTRFNNSEQYENIIKMVDFANKNDNWENSGTLDAGQRYVALLLSIKGTINKYINHKAQSGVKQNSYKKLAAVEELNNMITQKIDKTEFGFFHYDNRDIRRENYHLSYREEVEASNIEAVRGDNFVAPVRVSEDMMADQKASISDRYPQANVTEMMNVDGCMCRIILSAMNHHNVSEKSINGLLKMRSEFLNNPAEKVASTTENREVQM